MTDILEPPVPSDADLRDFPFTPLFRARLFGSSFHARANDAEWRAGVTLWLKSWDQFPAGSLPDDDVDLCRLAEFGRDQRAWRRVRAMALHGWVKCSDGRLYHAVVSEGVNDALTKRRKQSTRGTAGAEAKWRKHRAAMAQAGKTDGTGMPDDVPKQLANDAQAMLGDGKGREGKREGSKKDSDPNGSGGEPPSLEALVFQRWKELLGKSAGGQIVKLRKALAGDDVAMLALHAEAKLKQNPGEWVAAFIARRSAEPPTDALGLPATSIADAGKATDDLYRRLGVS